MKSLKLLILFLLPVLLSAQDTLSVQIERVTISPEQIKPLTTATYDAEFIESSMGEEPSLLLSKTPSIISYSENGNYQGYSYIRLRGIDQTRINFNLDGIPLNEGEDQGAYLSNFSQFLEGVDQVEIERGAGISPNTSSYVGSISFISEPLFKPKKSQVRVSVGSYNTLRTSVSSKHINDNGDFSISYGGSVSSGDGYRNNTHNDGQGLHLIVGKKFGNSTLKLINITGRQVNDLGWLGSTQGHIDLDRRHNQNDVSEDDNFLQSISGLTYTNYLSDNVTLRTTTYYNYLKGNYDFNLGTFLYDVPSTNNFNYDLKHQMYGGLFNIDYSIGNLNITNGYHLNSYSRRHIGSELSRVFYTNTGYKTEFSTNLNADYNIGDIKLYSNVQYRRPTFSYEGSVPMDDITWNFFNHKSGVSYKGFYYSYGSVSREPSRTDLFAGEDDLIQLSDVTHEVAHNHELGYRKGSVSFNIYRMDFDNEIVLDGQLGPNSLPIKSNVANSYRQGIEASVDHSIGNVEFGLAANLSQNTVEQDNEEFTHTQSPSRVFNSYVGYDFKILDVRLTNRNQSSLFIDLANTQVVEGYNNFDLLLSSELLEGLTISTEIRNLFNTEYYQTGNQNVFGEPTYFVAPTRNVIFNLTLNF